MPQHDGYRHGSVNILQVPVKLSLKQQAGLKGYGEDSRFSFLSDVVEQTSSGK